MASVQSSALNAAYEFAVPLVGSPTCNVAKRRPHRNSRQLSPLANEEGAASMHVRMPTRKTVKRWLAIVIGWFPITLALQGSPHYWLSVALALAGVLIITIFTTSQSFDAGFDANRSLGDRAIFPSRR